MAGLPISFQKIKVTNYLNIEEVKYLVTIIGKSTYWNESAIANRSELIKLKEEIEKVLAASTTAEILRISEVEAATIDKAHASDPLCKDCCYKMTHHCKTCVIVLQSPLERKLFLEFHKSFIKFQPQYALNYGGQPISTEGKSYNNPNNNFKDVLTVVDFYIEKKGVKLCIYTDGHTYHERTEEQAQRDRNIDRKLQELGFQVLRYTGKEVNENMSRIIGDIQNWLN